MLPAFHDQRGGIIGRGVEVINSPVPGLLRVSGHPQQSWLGSGSKGHIKAVQRNRKSSSQCFHESFFPGPAFEESFHLLLFRQSTQDSGLLRGKKPLGNFLGAKIRAELLNINTHFQSRCYGQERVFA